MNLNFNVEGFQVGYPFDQGCFDKVQFEKCGLVRLEGWFSGPLPGHFELPKCFVGSEEIPVFQVFRTFRPDVAADHNSNDFYEGIVFSYRLPDTKVDGPSRFGISFCGKVIFEATCMLDFHEPAYNHLLDESEVLHREDVYSFGAPSTTVNEEIFHLARMLPGPMLDLGCGTGVLVKKLRAEGIEAYGLELKRPAIVDSISPVVRNFVDLYDGTLPLPYKTNQFESVFASEVIEHVVDYEELLREIARVTRSRFTITVPDISSVPICHHNFVVPWHIIDSSHVNFFTQTSLERLLAKHFSEVESGRICQVGINQSYWYVSLVGMCKK